MKKLIAFFLIFFVEFASIHQAQAISWNGIKGAATTLGGYFTGSSTIGGATRTAAATVGWSELGGGLAAASKLAGGVGLLLAGADLVLDGTDYLLDSANNSVTYKPDIEGGVSCKTDGSSCSALSELYQGADNMLYSTYAAAAESICSAEISGSHYSGKSEETFNGIVYALCTYPEGGTYRMAVGTVQNQSYVEGSENAAENKQTITIPELLQKLIGAVSNPDVANILTQLLNVAVAGAQATTNVDTTLKTMLARIIAALTAAGTYVTDNTATGTITNPTTGESTDLELKFPVACTWFAIGCEAAQVVIDYPEKVAGWYDGIIAKTDGLVASVKDYFKDDDITEDPQLDQDPIVAPTLSEDAIRFSSQCPSAERISFSLMGQSANIELSWTPVCTLLSYLYYPILASAYIAAAYIVIGANKS